MLVYDALVTVSLADPGFEVRGGGSSEIHKSQRARANSSDKQIKGYIG